LSDDETGAIKRTNSNTDPNHNCNPISNPISLTLSLTVAAFRNGGFSEWLADTHADTMPNSENAA